MANTPRLEARSCRRPSCTSSPRASCSAPTSWRSICGPYVSAARARRPVAGPLRAPLDGAPARRAGARDLRDHRAGLDFYADLFDQPYPFAKYDQIFVPEYNSGAMENVGCVTYNEAYLFRDPPTDNQRLDRAEVLLHELAHMWFGNLVTMRWWDDLWLNESFATYISYLALTEATRFTNAWKVFNADIKRWAYQQDQLPTTHPIAGAAADTERPSSTSTASPTARARRSSSSSSSHRPRRRSATACASTSAATPGATPRCATSWAASRRPAASSLGEWATAVARDGVAQHARRRLARPMATGSPPALRPDRARAASRPCVRTRSRWPGPRDRRGGCRSRRCAGSTVPTSRDRRRRRPACPGARLPQPRRPRLRQGRARPALARLRARAARPVDDRCCASCSGCRCGRWSATASCARPTSWRSPAAQLPPRRTRHPRFGSRADAHC
jgi:hypothetical protein